MNDKIKNLIAELTKEEEPKPAPKPEDEVEKKATSMASDLSDKIAAKITESLTKSFNLKQETKPEVKAKAKKVSEVNSLLNTKVEVNETKFPVYRSSKTGKTFEITKSQGLDIGKWFKAVVSRDRTKSMELYKEIENKYSRKDGLEPMNETTAADGGVLVPTLLANTIIAIRDDVSVIRPRASTYSLDGQAGYVWDLPYEIGRPKVYWTAEQAQKGSTSATFGKTTFTLNMLAAIMSFTKQLNEDTPFSLSQIIAKQFGMAMAREEERAFILGAGTTEPTGLASYTPIAQINGGSDLQYDNINNAVYAMGQGYRQGSVWIMNANRISLIRGLKDSQNRPLFMDSLTQSQAPRVLGYEVLENNNVANNRIYFCNLEFYWVVTKGGLAIDTSDQAYVSGKSLWEHNLTAVRAEERLDGQLVDTRALVAITNP
jgi:HK97 family phage major capsid protein